MQPTLITREQRIRQALADALQSGTPENNISVNNAAPAIGVLNSLGFRVIRAYAQPSVSGPINADAVTFEQIRQAGLEDWPVNVTVHFAGVEEDGHNLARLIQQLAWLESINNFHRLFETIYGRVSPAGETPDMHLLNLKVIRDAVEHTIRGITEPFVNQNPKP